MNAYNRAFRLQAIVDAAVEWREARLIVIRRANAGQEIGNEAITRLGAAEAALTKHVAFHVEQNDSKEEKADAGH